jgi:hypothetical protein
MISGVQAAGGKDSACTGVVMIKRRRSGLSGGALGYGAVIGNTGARAGSPSPVGSFE